MTNLEFFDELNALLEGIGVTMEPVMRSPDPWSPESPRIAIRFDDGKEILVGVLPSKGH